MIILVLGIDENLSFIPIDKCGILHRVVRPHRKSKPVGIQLVQQLEAPEIRLGDPIVGYQAEAACKGSGQHKLLFKQV